MSILEETGQVTPLVCESAKQSNGDIRLLNFWPHLHLCPVGSFSLSSKSLKKLYSYSEVNSFIKTVKNNMLRFCPWVDLLNVSVTEIRKVLTLGKMSWATKHSWVCSSQDELVPVIAPSRPNIV